MRYEGKMGQMALDRGVEEGRGPGVAQRAAV